MTEFYMKAVGVTFEGRQRIIARLRVGDALYFRPDPHNPYDPCAVRIETASGEQIGFISRANNQRIFQNLMDRKGTYSVTVSSVTGGGFDTNYGVNMRVVYSP